MKILVATSGEGGLGDIVSPVFGRCPIFTIVDIEGKDINNVKVVQNQYASGTGGVGIQVAQFAVNEKVNVVMAGNFGPNASTVLMQAKIEAIQISNITVKEAVTKYLNKELPTTQQNPLITSANGPGMGYGRGRGRDMRRGRGGGRRK